MSSKQNNINTTTIQSSSTNSYLKYYLYSVISFICLFPRIMINVIRQIVKVERKVEHVLFDDRELKNSLNDYLVPGTRFIRDGVSMLATFRKSCMDNVKAFCKKYKYDLKEHNLEGVLDEDEISCELKKRRKPWITIVILIIVIAWLVIILNKKNKE